MKTRALSNLYYQFGQALNLDWQTVAACLEREGLIEYVPSRKDTVFSHYSETPKLARLLKSEYGEQFIKDLLLQYQIDNGGDSGLT